METQAKRVTMVTRLCPENRSVVTVVTKEGLGTVLAVTMVTGLATENTAKFRCAGMPEPMWVNSLVQCPLSKFR